MRPTRILRPGAVLNHRLGPTSPNQPPDHVPSPDCCETDPDEFPDRGSEGGAQVPAADATPDYVQYKFSNVNVGDTVTVVLDAPPTPGNTLWLFLAARDSNGITYDPAGSGWNAAGSGYTGDPTGDWPVYSWWRTVVLGDTDTWSVEKSAGADSFSFSIVEVSGVTGLDVSPVTSSDLTTEPTVGITPTGDYPVVLLSGVSVRNDTDQTFTPSAGMTEIFEDDGDAGGGDNGPQIAVNYRVVATPSGSYTVGSTYGGGSRRAVIAVAFGGGTGFDDGSNAIDGDDATYVQSGGTEAIRLDLGGEYAIGRIRWLVGTENAGARSYELRGANEADFSDEVVATTLAFTGTGTYTAQEVTDTWIPSGSFRYWRLVGTSENRRTFTIELYEVPDASGGVTVHDDLTGRDDADQHPADAVTYDNATSGLTADDVQEAIDELAAASFDELGWFNVVDYGAVHDGTTDDTVAIQDAIDACIAAGGGTVYFPSDGSGYTTYAIEGALQNTSTHNSQLIIPIAGQWTYIRFLGAKRFSVQLVSNWAGTITNNPAIIAAGEHKSVIGDPTYNPVYVLFEDIRIVAPDNPKLSAICMCAAISCVGRGVNLAVTAYPATLPTNSNAVGVCFPWGLNDGHSGGDWLIEGYYYGARPSEQFNADSMWVYFSRYALWFEGQTGGPGLLRHQCRIGRIEVWYSTHGIRFSGDERWVTIEVACFEHDDPGYTTTYDIDDASNYGRGFIGWHTTDYSTGPEDNLLVNGATGLSLFGAYAKRWKLNNVVDLPVGTNPSTNPANGRRLYADSSTGHLSARTSSGSVIDYEALAPSGSAGGDLSGTYPNPSVVDDSHEHTAATLPDLGGNLIPVDVGSVAYDTSTPGELGITVTSDWGVDAGVAYYDDAGAATGEEAALFWDADTGQYTVVAYEFP